MRVFLLKSLLLAVAVCAGQYALVAAGMFERPTMDKLAVLDRYLEEGREVLYFGDSTLRWTSPGLVPDPPIPDLLDHRLPDRSVGIVDHPAYHLEIYRDFCSYLAKRDRRPEFVVIPINLRSFSPEWDLRPVYQFNRERVALDLIDDPVLGPFYKPLMIFKAFELQPISQKEFLRAPVFNGTVQEGTVRDYVTLTDELFTEERLRKFITFIYMGALEPDHRKLTALREIIAILREAGIRPVIYLTPIDVEFCERAVGSGFRDRIARNAAVVRRAVEEEGERLLDLSAALPEAAFNWNFGLYPNEHIGLQGKTFVARQVANEIERLLAAEE